MHTGSPGTEHPTVDFGGRHVDDSYALTDVIGGGATGTVWRATDRRSGEQVAVKLLHEDLMRRPQVVTRFVQERAILVMLKHDHIVRVRDLLAVDASLGLAMDLVPDGSLRQYLNAGGALPPSEAAALLAQVASALAEAHRNGVVHRDLKPDNVLLDLGQTYQIDGPEAVRAPTAKLTDFGIARVLDTPGLTTPDAIVGTPSYMAPEIIYGGRFGPPVDVYALGIVLYELVTGRQPYAGGSMAAVLRRHIDCAPTRPTGLADEVWRVIEACMDKRPQRRPSAADLETTLRSLAVATVGVAALPVSTEHANVPRPRDHQSGREITGVDTSEMEIPWSQTADPDVRIPEPRAYLRDAVPPMAVPPTVAPLKVAPQKRALPREAGTSADAIGARSWLLVAVAIVVLSVLLAGALTLTLRRTSSHRSALGNGAVVPGTLDTEAAEPGPGDDTVAVAHGVPAQSVPAPDPIVASDAASAEAPTPSTATNGGTYGAWQCGAGPAWDPGHPVLARTCSATGSAVRLIGHLEALPGVQIDVTLTLLDAISGEPVAGPFACAELMFSDVHPQQDCGSFDAEPARGRNYVVELRWVYTGRDLLPGDVVRGNEFAW